MPGRPDRIVAASLALIVGSVLVASTAEAALPPYWQSVREIQTIINDGRVHDALKYEEPILSIGVTATDVYEIRTERCTLTVRVVDKPADPNMVGPRQFDIEIGEAVCE